MAESPRWHALVTGGTGFVGSRLIRLLIGEGWDVHAILRPGSNRRSLPVEVAVHIDDGSLTGLARAVEEAEPAVCFHLAGHFVAQHRPTDIDPLIAANVSFGLRLAESLAISPGVLVVNAGSYWQHADGQPYRPAALYAATKQAFQDILQFYAEVGTVRVVTLKLSDTYGPADPRPKLVNLLLRAAASGDPLPATAGDQLIDLVHVDDAARAFLVAAEKFADTPAPLFEAFSVGSGSPTRVRDVASMIEAVTGRSIDVQWGALPYAGREMFSPWDAGLPLPGWRPNIRLDDGLRQTWISVQDTIESPSHA